MKLIKVDIDSVVEWKRNPRRVEDEDFQRLKRQIQRLGLYKPLVVCEEDGKFVTIGGNMRLRALKSLGHKMVEVSVVDAKTDAERVEYVLSDNDRVGYYIEDILSDLVVPSIGDIPLDDYKLDVIQPIDVEAFVGDFASEELEEEEEKAENIPTIAQRGDLFQWVGGHRVLCGDAINLNDVNRLMKGNKMDMVITSPPYNVGKDYGKNVNDSLSVSQHKIFVNSAVSMVKDNVKSGRMVWWNVGTAASVNPFLHFISLSRFLKYYRVVVWKKTFPGHEVFYASRRKPIARNYKPNYLFEFVFIFTVGEVEYGKFTEMPQSASTDVWEIPATSGLSIKGFAHPAAFPFEVPRLAIMVSTSHGDSVYDCFLGLGTTLLAAEECGRVCYGMELNPRFVDMLLLRYAKFHGSTVKELFATGVVKKEKLC